jgi:K(+)-stimulated pyrophosphate-energized sodium pump
LIAQITGTRVELDNWIYLIPLAGILALGFALWRALWISRREAGTDRMVAIAKHIAEGAMAFLKREYSVIAIFVVVVAALLGFANLDKPDSSPLLALAFVTGALASALAGFFGMKVATLANVRTANAAREGLAAAFAVAFNGGSVMGMSVVGLGVIGLGGLFIAFLGIFDGDLQRTLNVLTGFSLGASSIALFARVGGGIFTKAADVGADLVGKVEAGIPEDDPRNPATIADNVGDNVGDVAGMGADLFESYVGAIVGAMVLGVTGASAAGDVSLVVLPLALAAAGIVLSIAGTFIVRTTEGGNPQTALNIGTFGAAIAMLVATFFIVRLLVPTSITAVGTTITALDIFWATVVGLAVGVAVGVITEHYCAIGKKPVNSIAAQSLTGAATNIIAGFGVGLRSTAMPLILIAVGIVLAFNFAGLYGFAIAALGMLSTTGIQLAVDAYGPISDNAGGIAEMSRLEPAVRERTDKLDAVGNTTAAIGKGFAIASAAMTALALFAAFMQQARIDRIDVARPVVMAGLLVGAMLPFLFSALAIGAVGRAATSMIEEVRRQFREIKGLMEGEAEADYARCVDISTAAAIKEMILPGLIAVVVPVAVGFWNKEALGGLLAGVTVTGVCLAICLANSGGAWDNAKKAIEGGLHGGKGSAAHKAAVVGDTVGDPFKDTAGPSLNILIKLMAVVSLVIAPLLP